MQEYIYSLIVKEQTEGLSEEEVIVLHGWLQEKIEHQETYNQVIELLDDCKLAAIYESIDVDQAWGKVESAISVSNTSIVKSIIRGRWIPYVAAAAMLVLSIGVWQYNKKGLGSNLMESAFTDVAPGGNRATLTLADGSTIVLNESQQGVSIKNNMLSYLDGSKVIGLPPKSDSQNLVLSTPKAGQYRLQLEDGTLVYLDAFSSLTYPSNFTSNARREVFLKGRAYFEVAKNRQKPFVVHSNGQKVEVLGTQFVIADYKNGSEIKTTLIEGKVRVLNDVGQVEYLSPGQQAISKGQGFEVVDVDLDNATSWKDGVLSFNDLTLEEIMEEAARWYDVDVEFKEDNLKKEIYYGIMPRFENLSKLLKALEKTGSVHFIIEGRKVIIEKKK